MGEHKNSFRNVIALGLVSFFTDMSTELILALLPGFVIYELKCTRAILGFIEGVAEFLSYVLRTFSGILSDIIRKRKMLVLIGYSVSNFVKPLLTFARSWLEVFSIRVVDRIGKGIRTSPRDALLSESISSKRIGLAFGIHRTLDQAGAIVGPLIALLIVPLLGFRKTFLISLFPGLIAVIILLIFVEEKGAYYSKRESIWKDLSKILNARFIFFLIIAGVFSLGAFNYSFILLKSKELGLPLSLMPLSYLVVNVAHTIIGIPIGYVSDKIGKIKCLFLTYFTFLVTCAAKTVLPIAMKPIIVTGFRSTNPLTSLSLGGTRYSSSSLKLVVLLTL